MAFNIKTNSYDRIQKHLSNFTETVISLWPIFFLNIIINSLNKSIKPFDSRKNGSKYIKKGNITYSLRPVVHGAQ